jgi:hypothetical protein
VIAPFDTDDVGWLVARNGAIEKKTIHRKPGASGNWRALLLLMKASK